MMPAIERRNQRDLRLTSVPVRNVTTGQELQADCRNRNEIIISAKGGDLIRPRDVLETPTGHRYVSDDGDQVTIGLMKFLAPEVRYFAKLLRFDQAPIDQFGRPAPAPEIITDQLPVCVYGGRFYSPPLVKHGDVLELSDGTRHHVRATGYENQHTIRLDTVKQQ